MNHVIMARKPTVGHVPQLYDMGHKARIFLSVDLWELFFRFKVGGGGLKKLIKKL